MLQSGRVDVERCTEEDVSPGRNPARRFGLEKTVFIHSPSVRHFGSGLPDQTGQTSKFVDYALQVPARLNGRSNSRDVLFQNVLNSSE